MNIDGVLQGRRTIHSYSDKLVDEKRVLEALHSALFAPNHKLTFPWHFTLVGKQTRTLLTQVDQRLAVDKAGMALGA